MVKHGNRTSRHCFSKKVGIASKAHDLVGEALIIFSISSSVAVSKANSSFTGLLVSTSESSCWSSLKDNDEECTIQRASTIVDFLHYYDTYPEQSVREIVNYLCTF